MPLKEKHHRFIEEYLLTLNASQAASKAGYSKRNVARMLAMPAIKAEIDAAIAARSQRTGIEQDRVLLEIARLAFNDPRRLFDSNGALLPVQDWPDEAAAAVSSIRVMEIRDGNGVSIGEVKVVKFWDKGKQLELAAKHLGMLRERVEIAAAVPQLIRAGRQRIRLSEAIDADLVADISADISVETSADGPATKDEERP